MTLIFVLKRRLLYRRASVHAGTAGVVQIAHVCLAMI